MISKTLVSISGLILMLQSRESKQQMGMKGLAAEDGRVSQAD